MKKLDIVDLFLAALLAGALLLSYFGEEEVHEFAHENTYDNMLKDMRGDELCLMEIDMNFNDPFKG